MEPEMAALCPRRTPPYLGGPHPPAPCSSHTGTASLHALPRDAGLGGDSATPLSRPRPATYESQQRSSFRSKQTRSTDHGGKEGMKGKPRQKNTSRAWILGTYSPRLKSQLGHVQAVWPWVSYSTSLSLSLLTCKIGIIKASTLEGIEGCARCI